MYATTRQMARLNGTRNWQTIPHRSFSCPYSGLVTKAIDAVPRCLLGAFLAPPAAAAQCCQIQVTVIDDWLMFHVTILANIALSHAFPNAYDKESTSYWVTLVCRRLLVET